MMGGRVEGMGGGQGRHEEGGGDGWGGLREGQGRVEGRVG